MKILHVNRYCSGGGLEQYLSQLFFELDQRGHSNYLLYAANSQFDNKLRNVEKIFVENLTESRCHRLQEKLVFVQNMIDSCGIDLVYVHQLFNYPLLNLLIQKKPTLRFVHDFKLICPDGKKTFQTTKEVCSNPMGYKCEINAYRFRCMPRNPFSGLPLIKNCQKLVDLHRTKSTMIVASEFMKSVLVQNGFSADKIHLIPYFTYLPDRKNLNSGQQEQIILTVGRITSEKGMDHLLRAVASIPSNVRLVMVGDGPALGSLKDLAIQLGIDSRVLFTGWLDHDKLGEHYRQACCVVVPSIWPEPFGIVGIEAMAFEKPVIAFDVGGVRQWLTDGETGFLISRGNEKVLAEKMNYLLQNPDRAEHMGQAGRNKVVKRFIPEVHLTSLVRLLEKSIINYTP